MPQCSSIVKNLQTGPQDNSSSKDKNTTPDKKPKIPIADLYRAISDVIVNPQLSIFEDKPPFKIGAFELRPGLKQPFIIDPNTLECLPVGIEKIRQLIMKYCTTELITLPEYNFTSRQAHCAADYWLDLVTPNECPETIRLYTDRELCFARIPFELQPSEGGEKTPLFNELFGRVLVNREQLKAFLWSYVISGSYIQQYYWLRGDGNDGKGSLFRVLERLFPRVTLVQNGLPVIGNKHWAVPFEGKRVVIFPDLQEKVSMNSGVMKSLTGGDTCFIDPKGLPGYNRSFICKLLIGSNNPPPIEGTKAEKRRLLYGEIQSTDKFDQYYEDKLWDELPYALHDWRTAYEKYCEGNKPIESESEAAVLVSDAIEDSHSDLVAFFESNFIEKTSERITPAQLRARFEDLKIRDTKFIGRFNAWLEKTKGIKAKRNGSGPRLIWGVDLLPLPPKEPVKVVLAPGVAPYLTPGIKNSSNPWAAT